MNDILQFNGSPAKPHKGGVSDWRQIDPIVKFIIKEIPNSDVFKKFTNVFCLIVISGGDVWVLAIKNTKPSDSGIYVCEVNSEPIVRSFHKLAGLYVYLN